MYTHLRAKIGTAGHEPIKQQAPLTCVEPAAIEVGWWGRGDWDKSVPVVGDAKETCCRWSGLGPDAHEVVGVA